VAEAARDRPGEVFLSHASANRAFARKAVRILRRHGLPVWYSETNLAGAQQWHDEIGQALRRCDWFLVVLSPQAVVSPWVKRELVFALNDRRYDDRIVPLYYKTCDYTALSWVLDSIQRIEFRRRHGDGFRELLRIWGIGFQGD
jgi:hypothetical protein